jgi:hypothetical protein
MSALAVAGVLSMSKTAHAQRYYYYSSAPPPPRYGYYAPAPREYEPMYQTQLGFDLEGAVPVGINLPGGYNNPSGGFGFKVRLGEQIHFPGVRFTPEVGYAFDHLWDEDAEGNQYGWDMNRFFGGARLAFGHFIEPLVYAHVGYGWRQDPNLPGYITSSDGGFSYDVGGGVDFHLGPHFTLGGHVEYASINIPYQPQWVAIGGHANFLF